MNRGTVPDNTQCTHVAVQSQADLYMSGHDHGIQLIKVRLFL